ncbi:MAG: PKD domain-containing protein [Lewinellaceae bacterium]|nr:PKD domain-containing protein [Saprospiraceae bacterium]MCB9339451.1 PKD domain-containing protein [Lewinellaceae bacterium]
MDVRKKLLFTTGLIPIVFCFQCFQAAAQCPITVNAGPDQIVCSLGSTATLNGSVSGTALGYAWSPPFGLSDPNSLTPTATVTGPTTYTLTAQAIDPNAPNLVTNGAFEAGNTGFTSSYTYNPLPITPGTYFLTTSPSLVLSTFPPCDDHTYGNGTGYMMLVNGAGTPGANIWCQTIPVTPNTFYVMSAWVAGSPIFPAQLQFYINGSPVGNVFNSSGSGCVWEQFSASWISGSATSASLCIVTQNSGNGLFGDDYVLDDVYFAAACTASDEVSVSIASVSAVLPPTAILPCNAVQTGIMLNGSASSSGPNISYQWTTGDGNILSGANTPNATVNAEGTYTLTVTYSSGGTVCSDFASITVLPDPNFVFATALANGSLNCNEPVITLDGSGSSSGPGITYAWSYLPGPGGVPPGIVSGGNTQFPDVNQPGTYTLTVTNTASGCTATDFVTIAANFTLPIAMASTPDSLSCTMSSVILSGNGSSAGGNFSYLWETTNGHIVSGENTLNNCEIDAPGAYTLTVKNTQNGCTATSTVGVGGSSGSAPLSVASAPTGLSCNMPSVQLSGAGSSTGGDIVYQWTTTLGVIDSGEATLTPWVSAAGTYLLIVSDLTTGCSSATIVSLTANMTPPTLAIAPPDTLTCTTLSVLLDGSNPSIGAVFSYLWTTTDGHILNGETTTSPEVDAPGTYMLSVSNGINICSSSQTVVVVQDGNPPEVDIVASGGLDCTTDSLLLDGSSSSTGPGISFTWTTANGHFGSGQNTLTPSVNAAGTYTLTIVDQNNNCTASDSVVVSQDTLPPTAAAGQDGTLTCTNTSLTLNGTPSSQGNIYQYQWATPNGQILSGDTTLMPIVGGAGVYILTITNQENGCTASDAVLVNLDTMPPLAEAGPSAALTCDEPTAVLDGSASSQGSDFVYQWTYNPPPSGGTVGIISGETTLAPEVGENGLYILTVTDTTNGCSVQDSVGVSLFANFPSVLIAPAGQLTCNMPTTTLSATASMGGTYSYLWTTADGHFLSGETTLSPVVDAPGAYLLTVTNNFNGCTAADVVLVAADTVAPVAEAGMPFQLSCAMTSAQLNGTGSSTGNGMTYFWSTTNGNIPAGIFSLMPTINAAGTYTLTVTNQLNGCTASDTVTITQDANAPVANAGPPQYVTCLANQVTLNGGNSSSGPGIGYQWTTQDGNILSGSTTATPLVDAPGTYFLMVTNTANNCQTLSSVMVIDFTQSPSISAGPPVELTCADTLQTLSGSASGGSSLAILWTTGNGNIVLGETTLQPTIDAPGNYLLTVTNQLNGCSATATAVATQDFNPPAILLQTPAPLTCATDFINLDGNGSSAGPNFTYLWTTPDGNILSGETTLAPVVNAPGLYTLEIFNQQNGCSASASLTVLQDTAAPIAAINPPGLLGCSTSQILLEGTGSSVGPQFSYQWTTVDGNILSGASTLNPMVDAPGTYQLEVTNMGNGCTATAVATVLSDGTTPVAEISPPDELSCLSEQITLDAGNSSSGPDFSIFWETPNGHFLQGETTLNPAVDEPGTYVLTIANIQNGCTATTAVTITENTVLPIADAGEPMTLTCNETVVALTGHSPNPGVTFSWATPNGHILFGENTTMPAVDSAGTYFLTVTDPENGCSAMDSVLVDAVALEGFSFEKTNAGCATGSGSIAFSNLQSGTAPFQFSVDGGATFSTEMVFENLAPGFYELVVKDADGCKLAKTAEVAGLYEIVIQLAPEVTLALGETLRLIPQLNILTTDVVQAKWTPATHLDCSDCLSPTLNAVVDETYLLEITDINGCTATAGISVMVTPDNSIYVPNAFSPNGDGINDVFMVFAKPGLVKKITDFMVFTRWGESVFAYQNIPPNSADYGWDGTHRGKQLGVGVYAWFAEVELVNGERKILKGEVNLVR